MATLILFLISIIITFLLMVLLSSILLLDRNFDKTKHNLETFYTKLKPKYIPNFYYYPDYNFELQTNNITNTFTSSMLNFSIGNLQDNLDYNLDNESQPTKKTYKKPKIKTKLQPTKLVSKTTNFNYYPNYQDDKVALEPTKKTYQKPKIKTKLQETFEKDIDMIETEYQETLNLDHLICLDHKGITNPIAKKKSQATEKNRNNPNYNKIDKVIQECKKPSNIAFKFETKIELEFYNVIEDKKINLAFNFYFHSQDQNKRYVTMYQDYEVIASTSLSYQASNETRIIPMNFVNKGIAIDLSINEFMHLITRNDLQPISDKPTNKIITIDYKSFQLSLKQGSKFISKDFTKKKLVNLCIHNGLVVATDSFQMYKHQLFNSELEHKFLLDINQIKELTKFKLSEVKEVTISINDDVVNFEIGSNTFTYELKNDFIPYELISPTLSDYLTKINLNNKVVQDTLKALKPSLSKETPLLLVNLANGTIKLECNDDSSRASLPLETNEVVGIQTMKVGLSNRYLLEMVKSIKAFQGVNFDMYINGAESVVVLKHDNLECILMPMDVD